MTVMKTTLIVVAASLFFTCAQAQTSATPPDSNTQPAGWDWEASIAKIKEPPKSALVLKLTKRVGGCVLWQPTTGAVGDMVSVDVGQDKVTQYKIGQTIHVWMNGASPSLVHPAC